MSSEEIARLYYQYFNERRLDEATELVDPQAVFHTLPTRQRLFGKAGYRAVVDGWLNAFEDARLDVQSIAVVGPVVQVGFMGRGTHTGDLVLGDALSVPATGRATELPFRDTLEIRDGLIVRAELDFDVLDLKRRLVGNG